MAGPFCFGGWAAGIEGTRYSRPGKGLGKGQVWGSRRQGLSLRWLFTGGLSGSPKRPELSSSRRQEARRGGSPFHFIALWHDGEPCPETSRLSGCIFSAGPIQGRTVVFAPGPSRRPCNSALCEGAAFPALFGFPERQVEDYAPIHLRSWRWAGFSTKWRASRARQMRMA